MIAFSFGCLCVGLRVSYAVHLLILVSCYAVHINELSIY